MNLVGRRWLVLLGLIGCVASGAVGSAADAADPGAPAGAAPFWLPSQNWVQDHWLPYEETTLYRVLGLDRGDVLRWLTAHDDHAPLLTLAREQGIPTRGLARRLVGPRTPGVSPALYRLLLSRAQLTLTQPHLAHHMLGHLMHVGALLHAMPRIFGYPSIKQIMLIRRQGLSYAAVAARGGVRERALQRRVLSLLTVTSVTGERSHQTPAPQAEAWLSSERKGLTRWLTLVPSAHGGATAVAGLQASVGASIRGATPIFECSL